MDNLDRPKATWYALRRAMTPVAVLLTDEGFSGLGVHVVNDGAGELRGVVRLELYVDGEALLESDEAAVVVPARGGVSIDSTTLFSGFRDLSWAYRFGPPAADVVVVTFLADDGTRAEAVHLPGGPRRRREPELGLRGTFESAADLEDWSVRVETARFAQWVSLDVPGWWAEDSWFHLAPGASRTVRLRRYPDTPAKPPTGRLGAFNCTRSPVVSSVGPR